eukprot:765489-Hanusia_phi.AAC.13
MKAKFSRPGPESIRTTRSRELKQIHLRLGLGGGRGSKRSYTEPRLLHQFKQHETCGRYLPLPGRGGERGDEGRGEEEKRRGEGDLRVMRVVQLNVKRFYGKDNSSTVFAIAAALAALDPRPNFVCLNEVDIKLQPGSLEKIASSLGPKFSVAFFGHVRDRYGNAIISNLPMINSKSFQHHIRGGSTIKLEPGTKKFNGEIAQEGDVHRITRGMLVVEASLKTDLTLTGPSEETLGKTLRVACTHLDHISSEQRKVQMQHICELLPPKPDCTDLLIGDFNALMREDYTDAHWEHLQSLHASRGWGGPYFGDLAVVQEHGFADCLQAAKPLSRRHLTAHVGDPAYRLDYCFYRGCGIRPVGSFVEQTFDFSDHYPVITDFDVVQ